MLFWVFLACQSAEQEVEKSEEKIEEIAPKPDQLKLKKEGLALTKEFAGQLKPELKKAMQEGGPLHAVDICSKKAPQIAEEMSKNSGWSIKRVSSKHRNPNATPDQWEKKVLEAFEQKLLSGVDPNQLIYTEVIDDSFRMMKAQPVEPVCLACHGEQIAPELNEKLDEVYPNDLARGYQLGQIRGAFSLRKNNSNN